MPTEPGELLAQLARRATPEISEAVGRVYELRLVGLPQRYTLDLTGSTPAVREGAADGPSCGLGMTVADLEDLLAGKVRLQALFTAGTLRVFGNVGDAMRLEALFAPGPSPASPGR
jgi:hypothetical protein